METNKTEEVEKTKELAIDKIPPNQLEESLNLYAESTNIETYVKIPFALMAVGVLLHNVFLAGKTFDIDTYETITNVEISIVIIIVLSIFIMAGIAMNKNSKLKEQLQKLAKKHGISSEIMQNEFSALAVHYFGGRGVQL